MSVLALQDVRAGYGAADVLRGVDLTLEAGTITCLVGPNGAGNSTVLRTVSGLLRPRQGRIVLEGDDIAGLSPGAVWWTQAGLIVLGHVIAVVMAHARLT